MFKGDNIAATILSNQISHLLVSSLLLQILSYHLFNILASSIAKLFLLSPVAYFFPVASGNALQWLFSVLLFPAVLINSLAILIPAYVSDNPLSPLPYPASCVASSSNLILSDHCLKAPDPSLVKQNPLIVQGSLKYMT